MQVGDGGPPTLRRAVAGQLVREVIATFAESDIREDPIDIGIRPRHVRPEANVLGRRKPGEQVEALEDEADRAAPELEQVLRLAPEIRRPATVTVPDVASSSAPTRLSRVVFPLPDGPRTTTNSPSSTSRSTPASAVTLTPSSS